jgi:hypothetical protein
MTEKIETKNGKRFDFRDLIYVCLIIISGITSYSVARNKTDIEIAKLQEGREQNRVLIERNQVAVQLQFDKIDKQLERISDKIDVIARTR